MAAAVPHLVGFRPEESLVVISLRGPHKRIGLTMRFDLPSPAYDEHFASEVGVRLSTDGASHALVVCCTERPGDHPDLPRAELIARIGLALEERGIALMDALLLRGGRWWSYLCDDAGCCPADGTVVDDAVDVAAAHALVGRAMLPNRQALVDSIRPVEFVARAAMEEMLDRVGYEVAERIQNEGLELLCDETVVLVQQLVQRYADPATAQIDNTEAARIVTSLFSKTIRDAVLMRALGADLDVMQSLFIDVCRRALPPYDAGTCTTLAWIAYANGNGSLVNVALERALASEPDYSLAEILREALHRQVPPAVLRETWLLASTRPPEPD
jgi:hypothetical protein